MTCLAVLQPGYLPWLGFFDQMLRADIFVYYDDVPFDKHGWRNRNRVKSRTGPQWLSVPVRMGGRLGERILDVEIDNNQPWSRKHIATLQQLYAGAAFKKTYLPSLVQELSRPWDKIANLSIELTRLMAGWLEIETPTYRSSELGIPGDRNTRLINLCRHFGADQYLSGNAAQDYLDVAAFGAEGIAVEWQNYQHPEYPQQYGDFVPYLSAIDLLLNCGPESPALLKNSLGAV
jgi:hypothetical protein